MALTESKCAGRPVEGTPPSGHEPASAGAANRRQALGPLFLALVPLLYLWWVLVRQLSIAWSNNPQYAYGWSVPFLCLYLVWRRVKQAPRPADAGGVTAAPVSKRRRPSLSSFRLLLALCALLCAPIRLVQAATPGWSLVSWALAGMVIGVTLLTVRAALGSWRGLAGNSATQHSGIGFGDFVFPICFFLVAVPWPYLLENPLIQALTRFNTSLTIELLGGLRVAAVPHGNLIELAAGTVGIDEACSGIRSLQATLMVSLFLGELYQLAATRRLMCVIAGFALALLCNLARMLLLCWVAAQRGIEAIAGWHDPGGASILVACFIGVWICARRLRPGTGGQAPPVSNVSSMPVTPANLAAALSPFRFSFGLFAFWLVLVECSVAGWYWHVEANLPAQPSWSINWPVLAAGYRVVPVSHEAAAMLRYDEAKQAQWTSEDGARWQLSWFRWNPGTAAGYLAKSHNPLICMPAAGYATSMVSPPQFADINGLRFPFRIYGFELSRSKVYVLYSRWEDRAAEQSFASEGVTRFNRLRSVWNGRGNQGQRVTTLAVWTGEDEQGARERLLRQLQNLLVANQSPHGTP